MAIDADVWELDEEFLRDPYAFYRQFGARRPVCQVRIPRIGLTAYLITGRDDVRTVMAHTNISKDGGGVDTEPFTHHMLNHDPPTHTRLRAVVNRAFRPGRIESMRPVVQCAAREVAESLPGAPDIVSDFAYPFAMRVLRDLLGVTERENDDFREVADVLFTEVDLHRRATSAARMTEYLTRMISAKRRSPGNDLLTRLLHACDDEGVISESEVLSTVFLLLVAGHETTVNLIGNGIWALLLHPAQLAAAQSDPELLPAAVDEILRWAGPAGISTLRHTTGPVHVGGVTIAAHQFVLVALECANRDPQHYPAPDRFDLHRNAGYGVAFGHGVHHCLGASLAQLEGQIAIGHLITRFPHLALACDTGALRWRPNIMMRGLERLPITLTPERSDAGSSVR